MKRIIAIFLIFILLITMSTALAGSPGSSSDPLVSQSYVDGTFKSEVLTAAQSKVNSAFGTSSGTGSSSGNYTALSLNSGEYVRLSSGASFMLLSGSAKVTNISGTVIDISTGGTVSSGSSLASNRRYFCAEDTTAQFAASTAVKCFVDGSYKKGSAPVETPKPKSVVATTLKVKFNGSIVKMEVYNIDGNTYYKLRDIAMLMRGTVSEFSVDFDLDTKIVSAMFPGEYIPVGGELQTGTDKSKSCIVSPWTIEVNGESVACYVYNLKNNNFFKLRDLGDALGFVVDYDDANRTVIINSADYYEE